MDVSIIIPVYNVEEYIEECLQSIISQDVKIDIECILVDDCGNDKSMDIISQITDNYIGNITFKIIKHQHNLGLSAARNTGILAASGEYVYFLDSDDLISENCIHLLWQQKIKYPNVDIITGDFVTFPQKGMHEHLSLRDKEFPSFCDKVDQVHKLFLLVNPIIAWNKLVRRDFILNHNLFFREGILHEDNHWQASAYHKIKSIAFVNRITYYYRIRPDSITTSIGLMDRKLRNISLIYSEMFAKEVVWDEPWARWVMVSLYKLKEYDQSKKYNEYKKCLRILLRNKSLPTGLKLAYLYHSFPRWSKCYTLLFWFFNRYVKRL